MGEKIKDLYPIHIGNTELMIELNEGYSNEGRVIHVQNKKFRYLFKEMDFLNLSANILRAKSELEYIRKDKKRLDIKKTNVSILQNTKASKRTIENFCDLLINDRVEYRIVEIGEKYASVIVLPEDYQKFKRVIEKNEGFTRLQHPYGELFGYTYLYQMKPFHLYKYQEIYLEIMFQLPCMSLTPKTWIPLDKKIQSHVWTLETKRNNYKYLDDISYFVFKVCWAIFKDGYFNNECVDIIKSLQISINDCKLKELFALIFFSFTDTLCDLLANEQYDNIVEAYYTYTNY